METTAKNTLTFSELVELVRVEGDFSQSKHLKNCEEYKAIIDTCESLYPALKGTEKQVNWAKELRSKLVHEAAWVVVNGALLSALDALKKNVRNPEKMIVYGTESYNKAVKACKILATQDTAAYYINNRNESQKAFNYISKFVTA